jgi:hypothetical protein
MNLIIVFQVLAIWFAAALLIAICLGPWLRGN